MPKWQQFWHTSQRAMHIAIASLVPLLVSRAVVLGKGDWRALLFVAPSVACMIGAWIVKQLAQDAIVQVDYLCCPTCLYDLSRCARLPEDRDGVRCPECGEPWAVDRLVEVWHERFVPPDQAN